MKQGNSDGLNASGLGVDLDALERDIQAAAMAKRSGNTDPLAELARIMGQDDPFAGLDKARSAARPQISMNETAKAPSFDEFLNARDENAPAQESVFDAFLDQPAFKQTPTNQVLANQASEKAIREQEEDQLIAAALVRDEDLAQGEQNEELFLGDEHLQKTMQDSALPDLAAEAVSLEAYRDFDDMIMALPTSAADSSNLLSDSIAPLEAATATSPPQFDDMLAEFESAMREAGGERISPSTMPSFAPVTIPPPPEALLTRTTPDNYADLSFMNSGLSGTQVAGSALEGATLAGAAAGGAAVIAASATGYGFESQAKRPRRGLMIAGGVIGVAVIGISVLLASGGGTKKPTGGQAPVIAANSAVTKERPANPGGVEVPNQDKEVLKSPTVASSTSDRIAPREEQPLDLKQAQAAAASQSTVRQIPGVVIIPPAGSALSATPSATQMPSAAQAPSAASAPTISTGSPSVAGNQPVARPVASVPISIAGQAPSTPVAAPVPSPVVPVASEPVTPVGVPKIIPSVSPQPVVAQPSAQTSAPAEPRRVRAVAIRPDGETTPSRAQAQPRVVPAAPRQAPAEEAASGTGPMRITPQALRGTQRVATAAPATEQPPAPAAVSTATSGGSGFSVQLGAEGSQDAARAKFNRVKGQHSEVLASQNANIRNAEVNGRSVYRIRVGNMTREQAVSLCERLKADGGNCFVARN